MADSLASPVSIYHEPRQVSGSAPQGNSAPSRSTILKWRLRYAEKGVRTSPADTARKKPVLEGWQQLATTDPRRIHAEFNDRTLPDYDGVLTPTGAKYGRFVLDVDSIQDLERLEEQLGVKLRGISTEVNTQSDNLQIHFAWPEGASIRNSVGKDLEDGFKGLDVRGEGGLSLLAPSAGYSFANQLPTAPAPPELVEWAAGRKKAARARTRDGKEGRGPMNTDVSGPTIPYGSRWSAMLSIAGKLHDGTRDLGQLAHDLEAINAARCVPRFGDHPTDRPDEVERVARLVFKTQPCRPRGKPDPEFEELMEEANRGWYERFLLTGKKKSTIRETVRACLDSAAKRREVRTADVGSEEARVLVFAESTRELAELIRSSERAISDHLRQLREEGIIVVLHTAPADRTTYGLVPGAHWCITPQQRLSLEGQKGRLLGSDTLPRAYELITPPFGWGSPVTNAMERVLCIVEAFGPQSEDGLCELLRTSRPRDLRRRELGGLEELGLLEGLDCGEWGLPADYARRIEAFEDEEYTTTRRRRRRSRDGKRVVTRVVEYTVTASENGRDALREARHAVQRAAYALHLERKPEEEDTRCGELLTAWYREREEADGSVGELERVEEPGGSDGWPDGNVLSPRVQGGRLEDDKERRVDRLVYEGMSRRLAREAVYGGKDVLEVGN